MRLLLLAIIGLAAAAHSPAIKSFIDQLHARGIESFPNAAACLGPVTDDFFTEPPIEWYTCQDYLKAIIRGGVGLEITPLLLGTQDPSTQWTDFFLGTAVLDNKARDALASVEFTQSCNEDHKKADICHIFFKPCNYTGIWVNIFTDTPLCREACEYTYGCTLDPNCRNLDRFNPDEPWACALNSMNVDIESFETSHARKLGLALLALTLQ